MKNQIAIFICLLVIIVSCSHRQSVQNQKDSTYTQRNVAVEKIQPSDWLDSLPGQKQDYSDQIQRLLIQNKKRQNLTPEQTLIATDRLSKYASFVMYNYPSSVKKKLVADKFIGRLFQSSSQFLFCDHLRDFPCMEQTPYLKPTSDFRVENPDLKLGSTVEIDSSFESSVEWYFNKQIFEVEQNYKYNSSVAAILTEKIKSLGSDKNKNSIYMALYGVDDIVPAEKQPGSLKPIYSALVDRIQAGLPVYGVFDVKDTRPEVKSPLLMTYVQPKQSTEFPWILGPFKDNLTNLDFQYNGGTQGLIAEMNKDIQNDQQSHARLEWKNTGIMHNKFFIFQNNDAWSVWTGTANISRTCLGTERNSNMSIYIKNYEIAQAYLTEWKEMFDFQNPTPSVTDLKPALVGAGENKAFPYGRFHTAKSPNTQRLFYFKKDDTVVRLYFSPTDDGEHRALIPLILSAQPGDRLLISMFGGAGIEYARSLQYAAARGVEIKVLVDSPTSCGSGSWAGVGGDSSLIEKNPYEKLFPQTALPIEVRKNDKNKGDSWKQNHQKIAVLLRKNEKAQLVATDFVVGSQNWSNSGNDLNDENLLVFSRHNENLKIGIDFQDHFLNFLWPKALSVSESGCADHNSSSGSSSTVDSSASTESL